MKELSKLNDRELEVFVRQRLGQKDAILCEHEKEHLRLSFHSASTLDVMNNAKIMNLFSDIWKTGDHEHSPIALGYKSCMLIGSTNFNVNECDYGLYGGWGTVKILIDIIKGWINGDITCFNGNYVDIRK